MYVSLQREGGNFSPSQSFTEPHMTEGETVETDPAAAQSPQEAQSQMGQPGRSQEQPFSIGPEL